MIEVQKQSDLYAITDYRVDNGDDEVLLGVVKLTPDEDDAEHYFFYPNKRVIPLTCRQWREIAQLLANLNAEKR